MSLLVTQLINLFAANAEAGTHRHPGIAPFPVRDGARHCLLQRARAENGSGRWIAVLHGDGDLRQGLGGGALDDLAGEAVGPRRPLRASTTRPPPPKNPGGG